MKAHGHRPMAAWATGAALAITVAMSGSAFAADDTLLEQRMAPDTIDTVVWWGGEFTYKDSSRHGIGADMGFVTALSGDLGQSGWIVSGAVGLSRSNDIGSRINSAYGNVLLGYLFTAPGYYMSVSGGVDFANNNETPPGSVTDGSKVGAVAQYSFETTSSNAFYAQSYGSYSTTNRSTYFHAKAGYKMSRIRFGPEFTYADDRGGRPTLRFGGFVGDIPVGQKVSMTISAGYQKEQDPGVADRFYAAVGFSVPLSLR